MSNSFTNNRSQLYSNRPNTFSNAGQQSTFSNSTFSNPVQPGNQNKPSSQFSFSNNSVAPYGNTSRSTSAPYSSSASVANLANAKETNKLKMKSHLKLPTATATTREVEQIAIQPEFIGFHPLQLQYFNYVKTNKNTPINFQGTCFEKCINITLSNFNNEYNKEYLAQITNKRAIEARITASINGKNLELAQLGQSNNQPTLTNFVQNSNSYAGNNTLNKPTTNTFSNTRAGSNNTFGQTASSSFNNVKQTYNSPTLSTNTTFNRPGNTFNNSTFSNTGNTAFGKTTSTQPFGTQKTGFPSSTNTLKPATAFNTQQVASTNTTFGQSPTLNAQSNMNNQFGSASENKFGSQLASTGFKPQTNMFSSSTNNNFGQASKVPQTNFTNQTAVNFPNTSTNQVNSNQPSFGAIQGSFMSNNQPNSMTFGYQSFNTNYNPVPAFNAFNHFGQPILQNNPSIFGQQPVDYSRAMTLEDMIKDLKSKANYVEPPVAKFSLKDMDFDPEYYKMQAKIAKAEQDARDDMIEYDLWKYDTDEKVSKVEPTPKRVFTKYNPQLIILSKEKKMKLVKMCYKTSVFTVEIESFPVKRDELVKKAIIYLDLPDLDLDRFYLVNQTSRRAYQDEDVITELHSEDVFELRKHAETKKERPLFNKDFNYKPIFPANFNYKMEPSIERLMEMNEEELKNVPRLIISNEFGSATFNKKLDMRYKNFTGFEIFLGGFNKGKLEFMDDRLIVRIELFDLTNRIKNIKKEDLQAYFVKELNKKGVDR